MKNTPFIFALCVLLFCVVATNATLVIGHRGFPKIAPENTMPSFRLAVEQGVDGLETDLRFTKDGVLVCLHDATLNRTTNCTGSLSDYTWDELQNCDASYNMPEFKGTKIPRFSEVVEFAMNHSLFVIMDYKSATPFASVVAEIVANLTKDEKSRADLVSTLVGSCWLPWQETDIATNLVGAPVQSLKSGLPWTQDGFWATTLSNRTRGFSIFYTNISAEFVELAHKKLMAVTVWTVDLVDDMKKVLSWGVDAIITDDCKTLIEVIKKNEPSYDVVTTPVGEVKSWVVAVVAVVVFAATAVAVGGVVYKLTKRSIYQAVPANQMN